MSSDPCQIEVKYDVGDVARIAGEFRDPQSGNALVDPSTVNLEIVRPDGTLTDWRYGVDAEVVRDDVGQYHADVATDQAGSWFYRWYSTGVGQSVAQRYFGVRATGPSECTTADSIVALANANPKRARNDQGEVEARSADDLIKLDQYQRKQSRSRFEVLQQSIVRGSKYPSCNQ